MLRQLWKRFPSSSQMIPASPWRQGWTWWRGCWISRCTSPGWRPCTSCSLSTSHPSRSQPVTCIRDERMEEGFWIQSNLNQNGLCIHVDWKRVKRHIFEPLCATWGLIPMSCFLRIRIDPSGHEVRYGDQCNNSLSLRYLLQGSL